MKASIGALRGALAGEHPGRVLAGAAIRINAAGVRIFTGQIFLAQVLQSVAPVTILRRGDLGNLIAGKRFAVVVAADFASAHAVAVGLGGNPREFFRPPAQQVQAFAFQRIELFVVGLAQLSHGRTHAFGQASAALCIVEALQFVRECRIPELGQGVVQALRAAGDFGPGLDAPVGRPALLGDLGQVPLAIARNQRRGARFFGRRLDGRCPGLLVERQAVAQQPAQIGEHPGHPGIVELARDGRVDRHPVVVQVELEPVALPLFPNVAQGVLGPALFVLVQDHHLGVIEHVDLLELAGRAVVGGHHVDRKIDQVDDLGIGLADAGGFDQHQAETGGTQETDALLQYAAGGQVLAPRGHRAHVDALGSEGIHPDPVAQQRAAGAPPGGIDGENRDLHVGKVLQEAVDQLVGDRRFAGPAGAGQAHDRHAAVGCSRRGPLLQLRHLVLGQPAVLDRRKRPGNLDVLRRSA